MTSYSFNTPSRRSKAKGRVVSATGADVALTPSSADASVAVSTKSPQCSRYLKNPPVAVLDLVSAIRRQAGMTRSDCGGAEWGCEGSSFLMNAQQKQSTYSPFHKQFHILPHPRGITNSSNFCFMNSILQVLLFIPPFAQLVLSVSQLASPIVSQHCPTLTALSRWFALYWRDDGVTQHSVQPPRLPFLVAPTRAACGGAVAVLASPSVAQIRAHYMSGSTQQDAQEFLQKLLETINVELFSLEVAVWESGAHNGEGFIGYEESRRAATRGGNSSEAKHGGGGCGDSSHSVSRRKQGTGRSLDLAADGLRSGEVSSISGSGGKAIHGCGSHSAESLQVNNNNNYNNNDVSGSKNESNCHLQQRQDRHEAISGSNNPGRNKSTKKGFNDQQQQIHQSQQQQQQHFHQPTRADKKWTFIKDNDRLAVREHIDSRGSSSLLQHIFGGTIESHLKGGRSRQRNVTSVLVEHYYSLPIDIGFAAECTLEEAIEHSCTNERIYDEDRDKDMRKSLLLSQLPNILLIHVRRWAITAEGEAVKLDNALHFKRALVIPQSVCADKVNHQARSYSLLSAVAHRGSGVEVGHYVTYLAKHAASPVSPLQQSVHCGAAKAVSLDRSNTKKGVPAESSASNQSSGRAQQQQQQRNSPSTEYVLLCNDAKVSLCPARDMFEDSVYFLVYQKNK